MQMSVIKSKWGSAQALELSVDNPLPMKSVFQIMPKVKYKIEGEKVLI